MSTALVSLVLMDKSTYITYLKVQGDCKLHSKCTYGQITSHIISAVAVFPPVPLP